MLTAIENGDVKEVADLIRQDPGFDVNKDQNGYGYTLLHYACGGGDRSSPVIPLLLAHPGIDVNVKNIYGQTPFYIACQTASVPSVREMLKDSRVKVNEPTGAESIPLWSAAGNGRLNVIK